MRQWFEELWHEIRYELRGLWPLVVIVLLVVGALSFAVYKMVEENGEREAFMESEADSGRVIKLTDHRQPFRIYKVQVEGGYVVCTREWGCFVPTAAERVERGN